MLVSALQVVSDGKTGNKYPQCLEMVGGGGGSGYLYLHYLPPVDREPAINVDMMNSH